MQKLLILDRDGVINHDSDDFVKSPDEWKPIKGSLEAIARLNQAEYWVVIITNQSGLARGLFTLEDLNQIHQKMHKQLANVNGRIEAIFFCPHSDKENCTCRKPRSGLFKDLANRLSISLNNVPAVGDSLRDLQAANAVGAMPVLVLTGKGQQTLHHIKEFHSKFDRIPVYENLAAFVDELLENS
ncbi:MAG: D-glycero-beta-D-manno-heptose-1,7-bisphosphate 7-phosphatase [Gammaproteobacteria bacterium]|nr:MAG: D-glycero-beta-D-manno-heptose-1,7-bisphosphate 7-phosphatase [Gammaproteobacteria bacterium]RKZ76918.1 MAG: D-glycero-beta-D-manno-heptose-1,7-bisphosphate 7-phosphatase [Gammaproteobacteria bacterium]